MVTLLMSESESGFRRVLTGIKLPLPRKKKKTNEPDELLLKFSSAHSDS